MSSYQHSAEIRVRSPKAELLHRALLPELQDEISTRSSVELSYSGEELAVLIRARDLVSLRASFNAWGRLLNIALRILEQ